MDGETKYTGRCWEKFGFVVSVAQIQEIYDRILKRQLYRYLKEMLNEGKIIKSGKCIFQSVTKTQKSVTETQKSVKNDTFTPYI